MSPRAWLSSLVALVILLGGIVALLYLIYRGQF